jgi:arylamine N-acetyltransferase
VPEEGIVMTKWVNDYLHHLGIEFASPSVEFLKKLYQAHLSRVPYEVTSKFVYCQTAAQPNELIPSSETFVQNLIERGFGGNCYILNFNFTRLLKELGFQAHLVKVVPGHVGIMVSIESDDFYVDVGYGSPLNELFVLNHGDWTTESFGEEIRFTYVSNTKIQFDRRFRGQSFVTKEIDLTPVEEADFLEDIHLSFLDSDHNRFMRRISMAYVTTESYCWVRDNRVVVRTHQGEQITDFSSKHDWIQHISAQFRMNESDLASTISFLEERGVDLGFKH